MSVPAGPGLYRIDTPAGLVYWGESSNLRRRWDSHRKKLMARRHHCILLRRAACEFGPESLTFTVIDSGPQWKSAAARKRAELAYIRGSEDSLNTRGNEDVYATPLRLPPKEKYRGRRLRLEFDRGVLKVRDPESLALIGLERCRGKVKTGYYDVDEKGFINAVPNTRRARNRE